MRTDEVKKPVQEVGKRSEEVGDKKSRRRDKEVVSLTKKSCQRSRVKKKSCQRSRFTEKEVVLKVLTYRDKLTIVAYA